MIQTFLFVRLGVDGVEERSLGIAEVLRGEDMMETGSRFDFLSTSTSTPVCK